MLNFNYYLPIYHFSISVTDIFAKNMSFKSKFQIISNIAFKFRYIGLHQSVNHVGDLFTEMLNFVETEKPRNRCPLYVHRNLPEKKNP